MKTLTVQPVDVKVIDEVIALLNAGSSFESVVGAMRSSGLNKIDSMKLIRDHAHISLTEAKRIVHLSTTWQDHLESDNHLHDEAIRALDELDSAHGV